MINQTNVLFYLQMQQEITLLEPQLIPQQQFPMVLLNLDQKMECSYRQFKIVIRRLNF